MKYHKRREGLRERQRVFDAKYATVQGMKKPGSLTGPGPVSTASYSRGIGTKRSQQARKKEA